MKNKTDSKLYITMEKLYKVDPSTGLEVRDIYGKAYLKSLNGKRMSNSYYTIKRIDDEHFLVCELNYCNHIGYVEGFSSNSKTKDNFKFQYGIISCNGHNKARTLLNPIYDDITIGKNTAFIESNEKVGCVELNKDSKFYGEVIIPPIFDNIKLLDDNKIYCEMDGYSGVLPRDNKLINLIKTFKENNPIANGSDIEDLVKDIFNKNNRNTRKRK